MTPRGYVWTLARNASGRATLQHAVETTSDTHTVCKYPITGWSRTYTGGPIGIIACKRCAAITGADITSTRSRLTLVS